VVTANL